MASIGLIIFIITILVLIGLVIVFAFYINNWLCFQNAPKFWCLKNNYDELSSVQVTEANDEDSQLLSEEDEKKGQFDTIDAKTIAAELLDTIGEKSKQNDEARSDISDENISKFGTVNVTFKFETIRSLLTLIFHGVDYLPTKIIGGSSAYQLCVAIFDENERKLFRWSSIQFSPSKFGAEQRLEFPELATKDINTTAVRIRLYGCERKRRKILLAETIIGLGNVNLKKPEMYKLRLEKRSELKHLDTKNTESKNSTKPEKSLKTVKITPIKSFFSNKSDTSSIISSSESTSSNIFSTRSNPVKQNPFIRMQDEENAFTNELRRQAEVRVEDPIGTQSELLVGLGYNPITGRLTVEIVKGNAFKNPLSRGDEKLPNSFVKVTVSASNNQEITRSKTELRRNQANPLFKEKFMFQVPEFQMEEVTLIFGVYHKKSAHRKEIIGWFSIGYNNTSDEELSHWKDMKESNGSVVYHCHLLQQNTISRRGLPGAN